MKTFALNYRGLKNDAAVRALREAQGRCDPDVMFLSETHLDRNGCERLRLKTMMNGALFAPSDGRSGGLALLWKNSVTIDLKMIHNNYIDVIVNGGTEEEWRLTGIYGEAAWSEKYKTWERLRELHGQFDMRWLVIGDWNEILYGVCSSTTPSPKLKNEDGSDRSIPPSKLRV
jgi:hypothetical protein